MSRLVVDTTGVTGAGVLCVEGDSVGWMAGTHPRGWERIPAMVTSSVAGPIRESWSTGRAICDEAFLEEAPDRWRPWVDVVRRELPEHVTAFRSEPVHLGTRPVGVLWALGPGPRVRSMDASTLRRVAGIAVAYALAEHRRERYQQIAGQLEQALQSRIRIEQAKGALARHFGIGVGEAFARLRHLARDQGRPLHDVAREIVDHLTPPLATPETGGGAGTSASADLRIIRTPKGLKLTGAARQACLPLLRAALGGLRDDVPVVIDLSGLESLDARCARVLLETAAARRRAEIVLEGASPKIFGVIAALGGDNAPGLRLVGTSEAR